MSEAYCARRAFNSLASARVASLLGGRSVPLGRSPLPEHAREAGDEEQRCRAQRPCEGGLAPAPAPGAFGAANGPRVDGFVLEEAVEFLG